MEDGLTAIQILRKICNEGKPQTVLDGAHEPLGSLYVEKVSLKSTRLSSAGLGQVIAYEISLVWSLHDATAEDQIETLAIIQGSLIVLYA